MSANKIVYTKVREQPIYESWRNITPHLSMEIYRVFGTDTIQRTGGPLLFWHFHGILKNELEKI